MKSAYVNGNTWSLITYYLYLPWWNWRFRCLTERRETFVNDIDGKIIEDRGRKGFGGDMLCGCIFPPFDQKWQRNTTPFSVVEFGLHLHDQRCPKSHTILHLSLLPSQGFCGLVKNNTVVLLQEFYDNGICIYLCNYSQGHIKAPDRGVCSCTHGKLTEVKKKLLRWRELKTMSNVR